MAAATTSVVSEKDVHRGHRDLLAAFFQEHPFQIVTWELLDQMIGRNYQQRVSDARRELHMHIENVPRYSPAGKRLTGDYRFRPDALGRDAADTWTAQPARLPLLDGPVGAYQR